MRWQMMLLSMNPSVRGRMPDASIALQTVGVVMRCSASNSSRVRGYSSRRLRLPPRWYGDLWSQR